MINKIGIKGCVGFSYVKGSLFASMILVRGNKTINVPLIWPLYVIMNRLSRRKNILGKILFKKSTEWEDLLETKKV